MVLRVGNLGWVQLGDSSGLSSRGHQQSAAGEQEAPCLKLAGIPAGVMGKIRPHACYPLASSLGLYTWQWQHYDKTSSARPG